MHSLSTFRLRLVLELWGSDVLRMHLKEEVAEKVHAPTGRCMDSLALVLRSWHPCGLCGDVEMEIRRFVFLLY